MEKISIGAVAIETGISIQTIRYYEREGLIEKPERKKSGYRLFSQDDIERLIFIRRAKELGFALKEIKELLSLRVQPKTTCADVKKRAEEKIDDIDEKISDLRRIRTALRKITRTCKGSDPISRCPIIDAMSQKKGTA